MMIRTAERKDLDQLYGLFSEHADYENLPFNGAGQKETLATFLFEDPRRIYGWVIEENDALLGYMTATIDYSTWNAAPFVYMDCLYIRPTHRGHGFGQQLMDKLSAFARRMNCNEIQWQTPPDNDLGIGFYNHIGAASLAKVRFSLAPNGDDNLS